MNRSSSGRDLSSEEEQVGNDPEASLRARIAAHALHASRDSRDVTAPARRGFMRKFELQVDPEGVLPPRERARRAQHALDAHMLRLPLKSAARRSRGKPR